MSRPGTRIVRTTRRTSSRCIEHAGRDSRARRTSARGFTLIEVIVAMAVIAIAFTALLGLHVRSLKIAAREQSYTQALLLARTLATDAELERTVPPVGVSTGDFDERFPGRYPGFLWERSVNDTPFPDTRELTVRVVPPGDAAAAAELTLYLRGAST